MLERAARARLRTLSKSNADHVAQHLVMAGRMLDVDPEVAYEHARAAMRSAGRVDIVREAVALSAYATGRYGEALREVRTVRRLSGVNAHPAIEADCERGLGRPARALAVVAEANAAELPLAELTELTIVESGARADLGELDAALLAVERLLPRVPSGEPRHRLLHVQADHLDALGRHDEAAAAREAAGASLPDTLVITDLNPTADEEDGEPEAHEARVRPRPDEGRHPNEVREPDDADKPDDRVENSAEEPDDQVEDGADTDDSPATQENE